MDNIRLIDEMKEDIIKSTQEFIQIKSVKEPAIGDIPFGQGVQDSLEYILNLGKNMGFEVKNVDNYAGHIEFGQGKKILGILAHVDVVPEGDNWDYPPYGGEIHNGRIYGRGTNDDKGPAIAALYAMKAIKDANIPLNKTVRLILGTDEESGMAGIKYYLKKEKSPHLGFTPDASFPLIHGEKGIAMFKLEQDFKETLNDGGIKVLSLKGGTAANSVPDYAEAIIKENDHDVKAIFDSVCKTKGINLEYSKDGELTTIKSFGVSAHGSMPEKGLNAISQLIYFLNYLDLEIGDSTSFIRFYSNYIGMTTDGSGLKVNISDEYGKLIFNVGVINLDSEKGSITVNIRYPISKNGKKVKSGNHVKKLMEDKLCSTNVKLTDWKDKAPILVKQDDPLVVSLMDVYKNHTGDQRAKPFTIGGGTYARAIKNVVAFGPVFPGEEEIAHQKNEYIAVESLIKATKIYSDSIIKLCQ